MNLRPPVFLIVLLSGCLQFSRAQAETVTFAASVGLRSQPTLQAGIVAKVAAGAAGEIRAQRGYWVEVETAQGKGWVKLSALILPDAVYAATPSPLFGLASGRVRREQQND